MADESQQKATPAAQDAQGGDGTNPPVQQSDDTVVPNWLQKAQNLADHEEKGPAPKVEKAAATPVEKTTPKAQEEKAPEALAAEEAAEETEKQLKLKENNKEKLESKELPSWLQKIKTEEKATKEFGATPQEAEEKSEAVAEEEEPAEKKTANLEDLVKKEEPSNAPTGLLETSDEQKEKTEPEPAIDTESSKPQEEKPVEKSEEKAKEKAKAQTVKKKFMESLTKVEKTLDESRTAGAPTEKDAEKKTEEKAVEVSKPGQKDKKPAAQPSKKQEEAKERQELIEAEKIYQEGLATIRDLISPSSMEVRYDSLRVEGLYAQSFYVYAYPRYLESNWLSPVINFDVTMDIAQFIYPIDSEQIMKVLKKKVAEMQSSVRMAAEKGMVSDPALETALQDAEELRTQIQRGQEKFFQFALYFTIYSDDEKKLSRIAKQLESMLGGKLVLTKKAELQMEQAFNSTLPMCLDEIEVFTNMNTSPLSSTFPFSSADLTSNEGILYGLNRHNDSLIIFDRFSLENANSVVFAKSGAGKSYAIKLEILRSMMLGTDVIVIDPENEYESLSQTVGGSYLRVSLTSDRRINPFDLPSPLEEEEVQPGDLLRQNIINLHGLLKIMLGGVSAEEEAILDRALIDVYAIKGITMEMADPSEQPPPTMMDLQDVLSTMEGATSLAQRLQKYTTGTYAGLFNQPTNVDLKSGLMVFCIRDLEDSLRPIAMYIILNYIWAQVRSKLKKRLLVIDEAWTMMQYEDSAKFLFGLVKRARKYYLGITTITQDVEDFAKSPFGKPVITNSSMQLLLKQAPAAIDILGKIFNLTEGEKYMLLNSGVGQGLFFAGLKHVAIQIIASYTEDKIITTDPEELLKERQERLTYEEAPAETEEGASEESVEETPQEVAPAEAAPEEPPVPESTPAPEVSEESTPETAAEPTEMEGLQFEEPETAKQETKQETAPPAPDVTEEKEPGILEKPQTLDESEL